MATKICWRSSGCSVRRRAVPGTGCRPTSPSAAYEAAEAIDTDNAALLKEELGDVLMQVVFHAGIEADAGRFDMDDVCDGVVKKLLYRHPHVFGDGQAETADTVPASWEQLKRQEI